jgi:hypothetical protein
MLMGEEKEPRSALLRNVDLWPQTFAVGFTRYGRDLRNSKLPSERNPKTDLAQMFREDGRNFPPSRQPYAQDNARVRARLF